MLPRLRRPVVALAVLLGLAPSVAAAQGGRAGVVTTLEGSVTVASARLPQPRPLKFKDDVFVNDRVVTGDRSIARMLLGGKALITVRERSSLTISEVPGKSTITLDSGKIAVAVAREKMRPGDQIEVRTPNAVAGVRGTVFVVEVTQATASLEASASAFTSSFYGFVGLVSVRMGSQVLTLNPGMYVTGTGLAPALSGVMTDAMRASALAGLQAGLRVAAGATQELANEQAMGTTVATFSDSAAAIEGGGALPAVQGAQGLTAPILPGGVATIPTGASPEPLVTSGSSAFLVFGDRQSERTALAAQLESDFPNRVVANVASLPSDLSAYGTVWHVGAVAPITDAQQSTLRAFLDDGGGLHLTGERPCCEVLNASLTSFLRSVVDGGSGITVGEHGDVAGPYTFNPDAKGGISEGLTEWKPIAPGGVGGVSGANVLVTGEEGTAVGAVWDQQDLSGDAGRVTLLMDVNWLLGDGASAVIRNINRFIDDPPHTLLLDGPLFHAVDDALDTAGDPLLDVAGYTVVSSSGAALIGFSGSSVTLPGSLARLTNSRVSSGGTFFRAGEGSELVQTSGEPFVSVSGGWLSTGTSGGHLFDLVGRPGTTQVDPESGLVLGTDTPIQPGPGAPVFRADSGASVVAAGSAYKVDTAVLAATAPLLALHGSTLLTGSDAIVLVRQAKVEIPGDALALISVRGGLLTVANGSLVNVAGGSRLNVAGSLLSLDGGSTVNILNGALLTVGGGSLVSVGGPLVAFSGSGNALNVTNSFVPTALIAGIPVYGAPSSFAISGAAPLAGLGTAGTITINGVPLTPTTPLSSLKGSLIAVQGTGTVKIGP